MTVPQILPGPRTRRRRRLAAAVRELVMEEARPATPQGRLSVLAAQLRGRPPGPPVPEPVLSGLQSLAVEAGRAAPPDADPPELLARIAGPSPIPAEVCVALGAILLPLLRLPPEKDPSQP